MQECNVLRFVCVKKGASIMLDLELFMTAGVVTLPVLFETLVKVFGRISTLGGMLFDASVLFSEFRMIAVCMYF